MPATNLRRIFILAGLVSLFLSYLGIWFRLINDPIERTGSDFIAFYSAGRIAQSQGAARVYDPELQQQIQQEQVGFPLAPGQILLYNHLPFLIPILRIIVSTDYVASFYRWVCLLIALYLTGIVILSQTLKVAGVDKNSILLTAMGAFLFLPVFFSLMNGQDTAFLFLGTTIWVYGLMTGKEYIAGLGLSLTTVRPHIALFLAIPMLFRYRKVFAGFLLGSGFLGFLSLLILGSSGAREFINILLLSASGEWYGMKENAMYNLIGILTRMIPQLEAGIIRSLGWIVYGLSMVVLCILWFRTKDLRNRALPPLTGSSKASATNFANSRQRNHAAWFRLTQNERAKNSLIGLSVTLALFVVPHLHLHDLSLLLIPIYELIWRSKETGYPKTSLAVLTPVAVSLAFLIGNLSYYLQYTIPYLIMLALAVYPYRERFKIAIAIPHRS